MKGPWDRVTDNIFKHRNNSIFGRMRKFKNIVFLGRGVFRGDMGAKPLLDQ